MSADSSFTEPLALERIRAALAPASANKFILELFEQLPSTNDYLLAKTSAQLSLGQVCLAEQQTAGRGRRGRSWQTAAGHSLAFSLFWSFNRAEQLTGLSLVIGLTVLKSLTALGCPDLQLKWPNDIVNSQRKLGGILLDSVTHGQRYNVVIGIGLNIAAAADFLSIEQPWTSLQAIMATPPARNQLAASLLQSLWQELPIFAEQGFAAYQADYQQYDALLGQLVIVSSHKRQQQGIAQGIDQQGHLRLDVGNTIQSIHFGEVSVRRAC